MQSDIDEYDSFDEQHDDHEEKDGNSSDEGTDDASETDAVKKEETKVEIKEQMYREKLQQINDLRKQLQNETLPEYCKKQKKLDQTFKDRQRQIKAYHDYLLAKVEKDYRKAKEAADFDFEKKKKEIKETLISELQEKRKTIETETMELTGAISSHMKGPQQNKRRLRERGPTAGNVSSTSDKKRKITSQLLSKDDCLLSEQEILNDLNKLEEDSEAMQANVMQHEQDHQQQQQATNHHHHQTSWSNGSTECRVENGRLFFDRHWYQPQQTVYFEKDGSKMNGTIVSINEKEIIIRKSSDGSKLRILPSQLNKGKCNIKKRLTTL